MFYLSYFCFCNGKTPFWVEGDNSLTRRCFFTSPLLGTLRGMMAVLFFVFFLSCVQRDRSVCLSAVLTGCLEKKSGREEARGWA